MDIANVSNCRGIPCTRAKSAHSIPSPTSMVLRSEAKYFAYKLGYLSRTNIQKEARKNEPQLYKLLGHATLFDNTRKYISEHLDDEDEEVDEVEEVVSDWDEEDDEPTFQYVEDVEDDPAVTPSPQPVSTLKSTSSKSSSLQLLETPRTLVILNASQIDSQTDSSHNWDTTSETSTEAGDEDDGHWSDSTCDEDDHDIKSDLTSDLKAFDIYPGKDPNYSRYRPIPEEDDIALWAQQPRVLSLRQVEDLFVEAFG